MIRVVLADDHALVRDGLRAVLAREPDIQVVGEAADGRAALGVLPGRPRRRGRGRLGTRRLRGRHPRATLPVAGALGGS